MLHRRSRVPPRLRSAWDKIVASKKRARKEGLVASTGYSDDDDDRYPIMPMLKTGGFPDPRKPGITQPPPVTKTYDLSRWGKIDVPIEIGDTSSDEESEVKGSLESVSKDFMEGKVMKVFPESVIRDLDDRLKKIEEFFK
jgi:hypothetical protein